MTSFRQTLADYLSVRRALGYKLERDEKLLTQFISYLEKQGARHISIQTAVAWATLPGAGQPSWWSARLSTILEESPVARTFSPARSDRLRTGFRLARMSGPWAWT